MSENLLIWKWSEDYDTPQKRRKMKIKFSDVTDEFIRSGDSPAFSEFDQDVLLDSITAHYPQIEEDRPFVIERYAKAICLNIPNSHAMNVIPTVGGIAMKHGLNGSQC